jgi:DNA replication protein DnaC
VRERAKSPEGTSLDSSHVKGAPTCRLCNDEGTRIVEGRVIVCQCALRKEREAALMRFKLGVVGNRFLDATFETYRPRNQSQQVARQKMLANPSGNFFLWGDYSAGKTHLLAAQLNWILRKRFVVGDPGAEWLSELELAQQQRSQWGSGSEVAARRVDIPGLAMRKRLHFFLDDLGKAKASDFLRQELSFLLDMLFKGPRVKGAHEFGLSVSANEPIEALADDERIGGAVMTRIDSMCEVIHVER